MPGQENSLRPSSPPVPALARRLSATSRVGQLPTDNSKQWFQIGVSLFLHSVSLSNVLMLHTVQQIFTMGVIVILHLLLVFWCLNTYQFFR